jgi:transcriptional regulator with XRE-family HTH domain
MKLRQIVGFNLVRLRQAADCTQEELASDAGVDRAYVLRLEGGTKNASLDTIERLATALHVPPAEFLKVPPKVRRKR